jgi:hypothetical protein
MFKQKIFIKFNQIFCVLLSISGSSRLSYGAILLCPRKHLKIVEINHIKRKNFFYKLWTYYYKLFYEKNNIYNNNNYFKTA